MPSGMLLKLEVSLRVPFGLSRDQVRALAGFALAIASAMCFAAAQEPPETTPSNAPQDAPSVTMAPHAENSRYWLSGQVNVIFQGRLPFHR